jgi:multiple antibiotic resistance protein
MPSAVATGLGQFVETVLLAVAALLPIVDPLGGAPIFLARTSDLTPDERQALVKPIALYSFLLLTASAVIGAHVLDFFGVSIPAVQVGGGLIVCSIAWALLNEPATSPLPKTHDAAQAVSRDDLQERAFYPLTMPLTVGPGSIAIAVTLGANPPQQVRRLILTFGAHVVGILIVALSVYLCYRYAERILRRLGATGTIVLTRLSAFILLCIGVQICWNGLHVLLGSALRGTGS